MNQNNPELKRSILVFKKTTKFETEVLYKTDIEEQPDKAWYLSSIQRLKAAVFMKKLLVNIIRVSGLTESQVA